MKNQIRYVKKKAAGFTSADQADQGAMTAVAIGDLGTGTDGFGDAPNAAKVWAEIDKLVADVTALDTLLTAIRTALVEAGIMKGAA